MLDLLFELVDLGLHLLAGGQQLAHQLLLSGPDEGLGVHVGHLSRLPRIGALSADSHHLGLPHLGDAHVGLGPQLLGHRLARARLHHLNLGGYLGANDHAPRGKDGLGRIDLEHDVGAGLVHRGLQQRDSQGADHNPEGAEQDDELPALQNGEVVAQVKLTSEAEGKYAVSLYREADALQFDRFVRARFQNWVEQPSLRPPHHIWTGPAPAFLNVAPVAFAGQEEVTQVRVRMLKVWWDGQRYRPLADCIIRVVPMTETAGPFYVAPATACAL